MNQSLFLSLTSEEYIFSCIHCVADNQDKAFPVFNILRIRNSIFSWRARENVQSFGVVLRLPNIAKIGIVFHFRDVNAYKLFIGR